VKIHHSLVARPDDARPLVLAIGFFDGFHRGHREIVRRLMRERRPGMRAAVLTFENHPATLLRPETVPSLITTREERVNLLAAAGIDELYLLPFDNALAEIAARRFVEETLLERLRVRAVVVGENFRFGAGKLGDAASARDLLAPHGVALRAVPPVVAGEGRISSTRIREAIVAGAVDRADELLGAAYALRGRVVLGEGRGHDLGFPTANLEVRTEKLLPRDGVYACVARYDGRDRPSLVSIGAKPTFGGRDRVIEAWVRDFHETIYGAEMILRDLRFVREQRRFATVGALLAQMREDVAHVPFPEFA